MIPVLCTTVVPAVFSGVLYRETTFTSTAAPALLGPTVTHTTHTMRRVAGGGGVHYQFQYAVGKNRERETHTHTVPTFNTTGGGSLARSLMAELTLTCSTSADKDNVFNFY